MLFAEGVRDMTSPGFDWLNLQGVCAMCGVFLWYWAAHRVCVCHVCSVLMVLLDCTQGVYVCAPSGRQV